MTRTIKYKNGKLNAIGKVIKEYRNHNQLTQLQLSSKMQLLGLDMSIDSLKKIESGKRIIKDYELARIFYNI